MQNTIEVSIRFVKPDDEETEEERDFMKFLLELADEEWDAFDNGDWVF